MIGTDVHRGSDAQSDAAPTDEPGPVRARCGDWLVVPAPPSRQLYRWGRIVEVIDSDGPLRYRVCWLDDLHDSVVAPPSDARVESAARWPQPGADAHGVRPY